MISQCCDQRRREAVRAQERFNGIDYLEVKDSLTLHVHFIHPLKHEGTEKRFTDAITKEHVSITGGVRIQDVEIDKAYIDKEQPCVLIVMVKKSGDFSTYTLHIKSGPYMPWLDPVLSKVDFTFAAIRRIDCETQSACQPEASETPEIDYLAKDFTTFRQLMLDRLTTLMPQWAEKSEADLGVVLVELLAYVGDYLSYQQDVIATEAYLSTARRRTSVRRHARLLEYFMSEGCSARTWVQIRVKQDIVRQSAADSASLPKGTQFVTKIPGQSVFLQNVDQYLSSDQTLPPATFETLHDVDGLFQEYNELYFYTWGTREYSLPKGTTRAALWGHLEHLQPGDILIFQENTDPRTGVAVDADPLHRQAVRLTKVIFTKDPLGRWVTGMDDTAKNVAVDAHLSEESARKKNREPDYSLPITEIEWHYEDALAFPLCISSTTDDEHGQKYNDKVSVALGNIVLADHGVTRTQTLDKVPSATLSRTSTGSTDWNVQSQPTLVPARYYPSLDLGSASLTYQSPHNREVGGSAQAMMRLSAHKALPAITLKDDTAQKDGHAKKNDTVRKDENAQNDSHTRKDKRATDDDHTRMWLPQNDLLNSGSTDHHFVVEREDDGTIFLRFGDNQHGQRPDENTVFTATYRVGNGIQGNIGQDTLYHIVSDDERIKRIDSISNPLPASGGTEPESIENVRQQISSAFQVQERCVTLEDYEEIAERHPEVTQAKAVQRWTGSWCTVFLVVERVNRMPVDEAFKNNVRQYMEKFRMVGRDLKVVSPVYVSLEIAMTATVQPGYFQENVKRALFALFSNRQWPDGTRGIFYPDKCHFGQSVFLNSLYGYAGNVPGVASVDISMFQRQGMPGTGLLDGVLALDWPELARMENDPDNPEHGLFLLKMKSGK